MEATELELASTEDLIKELGKRGEACVIAMLDRTMDKTRLMVRGHPYMMQGLLGELVKQVMRRSATKSD